MDKRLGKQIIYGAGYLAAFLLIIFAIYFFWFKLPPTCFDKKQNQRESDVDCGGPCLPCEAKNLQPIVLDWRFFSVNNKAVIVAHIKNPNVDYGAHFVYNFDFYSKDGSNFKGLSRQSFIYPAEIKYLFESTDVEAKNLDDLKIYFSNVNVKSKEEFSRPNTDPRQIDIKPRPDAKGVELSGLLFNKNAFSLAKVKIIALLSNKNGLLIAASKTELENLKAFEEEPFKIIFSSLDWTLVDSSPSKTKIYVEALR